MVRVIGPTSISEWVSRGMRVFVMGDYHQRKAKCPTNDEGIPIGEFIKQAITKSPTTVVDLYIETAYLIKGIQETNPNDGYHTSYLDDVVSTFGTCFLLDGNGRGRECPYDNLRTHHLDFRLVYDNPAVYVLDLASWANVTDTEDARISGDTLHGVSECLRATLHNIDQAMRRSDDLLEIVRLLYDRKDVIRKKRDSLAAPIRNRIHQFLHHRIKAQKRDGTYGSFDVDTIRDNILEVYDMVSSGTIDVSRVDDLLRGFMFASNYALDMYVLYSVMSNGNGSDHQPSNAIVYVGALHAKGVNEFLGEWMHYKLASYVAEEDGYAQCLNLGDDAVDWFTDHTAK